MKLKLIQGTLLTTKPRMALPPGYYAAASSGPAYAGLRAAIAAGKVQLVGERFVEHPDGGLDKVTTGLLERAAGAMRVAANPQIGMGPDSFVRELETYTDWQIKWWREVVQNSVDAQATKIDLSARQLPNGNWLVTCRDNGTGMSEEILVTKFLYLGGTTKVGEGPPDDKLAGGFGIAKRLILLPWLLWEILSNGTHVVGVGPEYHNVLDQSADAEAFFARIGGRPAYQAIRGTEVRVIMPPDKHTTGVQAMAFVEKSFLPQIRFTIDGAPERAKLATGELIEDIGPGTAQVFFTKRKNVKRDHILVRARGLFMFDIGIDQIDGDLIVEVVAPSIQVLAANRDSFRDYTVRYAVSKLGTRIAKDVLSALRSKKGLVRKKYKGSGKFKAKAEEVQALAEATSLVPEKGKLPTDTLEAVLDAIEPGHRRRLDPQHTPPVEPVRIVDTLADPAPPMRRQTYDPVVMDEVEKEILTKLLNDERPWDAPPPDMPLEELEEVVLERVPDGRRKLISAQQQAIAVAREAVSAATDSVLSIGSPTAASSAAIMAGTKLLGVSHVEAAIKQLVWEPDFYVYNNVDGWRVPRRFYPETMSPTLNKLAGVWTELCRYVLIQLGCSLPFGVGWIFQEETGAAYLGGNDEHEHYFERHGEHWLLLNPFMDTKERKKLISPTSPAGLKWLFAAAIHEATHMADGISYHDQSFARALTRNMALCADGFRHAKRVATSIRMKSRAVADVRFPRGRRP